MFCVLVVAKITHHWLMSAFGSRLEAVHPRAPDLNIVGDLAVVRSVPGDKITHHPRPLANRPSAFASILRCGGGRGRLDPCSCQGYCNSCEVVRNFGHHPHVTVRESIGVAGAT